MKKLSKIFAVALVLVMVLAMLPMGASAASNWTEVELSAVGANDMIAIVIVKGGSNAGSYALKNEANGGDLITFNAASTEATQAILWNVSAVSGGYTFKQLDSTNKYLSFADTNDGVTIGATSATFNLTSYTISGSSYKYLTANDVNGNFRTLCVYNAQDFRCYKLSGGAPTTNASSQNVKFYKWTGAKPGAVPATEGTIAEAVAADLNTKWKITGAITLIEGNNLYIEDATGAICARLASAPTGYAIGDNVTVEGTRSVYNKLPQMSVTECTKVSKTITITPKTVTLPLAKADLCKAIQLNGVTVTEIKNNSAAGFYDVTVSDGTNSVQIYKAVVASDLAVGDTVNITAVVSCYNDTLQLRNDAATDIAKVTNPNPPTTTAPATTAPATTAPATTAPATTAPATTAPATTAPATTTAAADTTAAASNPDTGDNTAVVSMITVMALAVTVLAVLVISNKKRAF